MKLLICQVHSLYLNIFLKIQLVWFMRQLVTYNFSYNIHFLISGNVYDKVLTFALLTRTHKKHEGLCSLHWIISIIPPLFPVLLFLPALCSAIPRLHDAKRKPRIRNWRKGKDAYLPLRRSNYDVRVVAPLGLSPHGHGSSRGETSVRALSCPRLALLAFYYWCSPAFKGRSIL